MNTARELISTAEDVSRILEKEKVSSVVIGAIAMAAHQYVRYTQDIDLGVDADLPTMRRLADKINQSGYHAILHKPDGNDPLGGVMITITRTITKKFTSRMLEWNKIRAIQQLDAIQTQENFV